MLSNISSSSFFSNNYSNTLNPKIKSISLEQINPKNNAINNKILGYGVDKDGYFTSDFNKAAGIPEDIKIHSSTMENLVKTWTSGPISSYKDIDIAKTIGNAYKIVSQLVDKSPELKGQTSFSQDDLAKYFPQNYKIDEQSGEVKQIYSYDEVKNIVKNGGFKDLSSNESIVPSFFNYDNTSENSELLPFNPDILHSAKKTALSWDTTADKYTNNDGSITMGGLLIGFLSNNAGARITPQPLIEGETTMWGKIQGLDSSMDQNEIKSLSDKLSNTFFQSLGDVFDLLNTTDISEFERKLNTLSQNKSEQNSSNFLEWIQKIIEDNTKLLYLKA